MQIEKEDKVDPTNGSLIDEIRVLRHEMLHIQFSMIDVGYGESLSLDDVINHIFSGNINPSGLPYAVRGSGLWIEAIETIEEGNSQGQHLIRCNIEKKYQKLSGVIYLAGNPPLSP